jgi:hypothetical protein
MALSFISSKFDSKMLRNLNLTLMKINKDYNSFICFTRRGRQMCDGFLNKKNQGGCPDCPYHHPEMKRPNVGKFTRKKMTNFDAFLAPMGQAGRSPLWIRIFLPEFLFYY